MIFQVQFTSVKDMTGLSDIEVWLFYYLNSVYMIHYFTIRILTAVG